MKYHLILITLFSHQNRNLSQYRKYCDNKKVINHKHTLFKSENVAYNVVNDNSVYYDS